MIERVGPWTLDCAPDETRRFYQARPGGGAEVCGCLYCRNFAEARSLVFGEPLQELLGRLGIDWCKEDDAGECRLLSSGLRLYAPWFTFAGRIVEVTEDGFDELELRVAPVHAPIRGELMGDHLLQVDLHLEVPWVIAEDEPNF